MPDKPRIIHIDETEKTGFGHGQDFAASVTRIGAQLEMKKMGCTLVELEPGKRAWPYHLHYGQEELFVILKGGGTLRYDGQEYPIRTGDIIFTPPGPGTAHQIINTSEANLHYLALSSMDDPEICYYPDSGKYGAYSWKDGTQGRRFLARSDDGTDYWNGEQGGDD